MAEKESEGYEELEWKEGGSERKEERNEEKEKKED